MSKSMGKAKGQPSGDAKAKKRRSHVAVGAPTLRTWGFELSACSNKLYNKQTGLPWTPLPSLERKFVRKGVITESSQGGFEVLAGTDGDKGRTVRTKKDPAKVARGRKLAARMAEIRKERRERAAVMDPDVNASTELGEGK